MGDDGFSASELRKRNLRGGTVPDDQLTCVPGRTPLQCSPYPSTKFSSRMRTSRHPLPAPGCIFSRLICAGRVRRASQLRARHAEPETSPVLYMGAALVGVVVLGAVYFLFL
eukprot:COSAG05_NODE_1263_length_5338_cov_44.046956_2_plen_112_part_00